MRILKVLARAYAAPEQFEAVIAFYEQLFDERCQFRLPLPALGLEIVAVGSVHLLAGSEEKLIPFRAAQSTFFVDSVANAEQDLKRLGVLPVLGPERGPGGSFLIARHPDGLVVEYIDQAS
jgi:hypothetical protein